MDHKCNITPSDLQYYANAEPWEQFNEVLATAAGAGSLAISYWFAVNFQEQNKQYQ